VSEDNEPDWAAELAKGGEALRRQVESIVRAAEQFAAGGSARPWAQRITRAMDAAMRELQPPPVHAVVHPATLEVSVALPAVIVFSGGAALAPLRFSGQVTVENPPSGQAERSLGQILALMLVAVAASGLLGVQGPDRATVDHYLTVIGVLLPIAWFLWNMHK
jgi:hypothetical protein